MSIAIIEFTILIPKEEDKLSLKGSHVEEFAESLTKVR